VGICEKLFKPIYVALSLVTANGCTSSRIFLLWMPDNVTKIIGFVMAGYALWLAVRPWRTTNWNNINKKLDEMNRK